MPLEKYQPGGRKPAPQGPRDAILYVEDDDGNWEVTVQKLRHEYDLDRARNAREAFDLLRRKQYAAILMDIELQGSELNGVEITRILRGKFDGKVPPFADGVLVARKTPIIFVSAYSARYTESQLQASGGDRLISKPVDYVQLTLALTGAALNSSRDRMARLLDAKRKT